MTTNKLTKRSATTNLHTTMFTYSTPWSTNTFPTLQTFTYKNRLTGECKTERDTPFYGESKEYYYQDGKLRTIYTHLEP